MDLDMKINMNINTQEWINIKLEEVNNKINEMAMILDDLSLNQLIKIFRELNDITNKLLCEINNDKFISEIIIL